MEIFNEMLKVNDKEIMIIYDISSNIWFGLRDLLKILNYKNLEKAITQISISKNNIKIYSKIEPPPRGGVPILV
jgi:hypothetical protein